MYVATVLAPLRNVPEAERHQIIAEQSGEPREDDLVCLVITLFCDDATQDWCLSFSFAW
jgi:hypothetical protein